MNENQRTHLDLFSGIGGFALAARECGVRTVAFCEIEPYAQLVLQKNFGATIADNHIAAITNGKRCFHQRSPKHSNHQRIKALGEPGESADAPRIFPDIRTLDGRQFAGTWLLTGGFPCQPFSHAGKRRGAADDRHLWPEMLRVISEARPAWVIGENVAGFVSMELDNCVLGLEALGYAVQPLVVPACAVDAKHRRDRCWILAHADDCQHRPFGAQPDQRNIPQGDGKKNGDAAHAARIRSGRGLCQTHAQQNGNEPADRRATAANGHESGREQQRRAESGGEEHAAAECGCRWLAEPEVGRVAHGIPRRVDRLRGLGNAIVPQVAKEIIAAIIQTEDLTQ